MPGSLEFGYRAESSEAKARWFQSLSVQERIDIFVELTNLALARHPEMAQKKHDRPTRPGVLILNRP